MPESEYGLRPDPGLPVPPYWAERLAAGLPGRADGEPPGGGERIRAAAAGYWERRGLATRAQDVAAAPGGQPLLLAVLAALGGDVVYARPGAAWHAAPARLLGRPPLSVPPPAEGGGAPDPFALLEVVRRDRREGGGPRALVMAGADDPTGTVTPPELMHEVCEAALDAGLVLVSDETFADTVHPGDGDGGGAVLLSPAEMLPGRTVVLTDLGAALAPPAWPVAVARFPGTEFGARLRALVLRACADLGAVLPGPVAEAAAYVLGEPEEVRARVAAATRLHAAVAAAAHRVVTAAGALCRPPEAGFQLYADLGPLGTGLAAPALEHRLRLPGGHRFGDDPDAPRVRIDTPTLYGTDDTQRTAALSAPDPLALPHVSAALKSLSTTLTFLP